MLSARILRQQWLQPHCRFTDVFPAKDSAKAKEDPLDNTPDT